MGKGGQRTGAGRPAHKLKAEEASALDVSYLSRHGYLVAGSWKRLYWRRHGQVRLEGLVKAFDDHLTIDIGFHTHWIGMTQTPCHFGGHRCWFICRQCGTRMAVLYMRHGRFACRHCQQIAYQSQSGDAEDRLIWRYLSLRDKALHRELMPARSRRRTTGNFIEAAIQYDALLDKALSSIATADASGR